MIDFSDIVIRLDEEEIHSQLYRHHFPEYMHMIYSRTVSFADELILVKFLSYCDKTAVAKEDMSFRFENRLGLQDVQFIPGYTEYYFRFTNKFDQVTCPVCRECYPLDLLSKV